MSQGQPGGNPTRKFLDAGYRYLVAQLGGRKPCQPGQVAMVKVGQFVEEVASLLVVLGNGDSRGSKESVVRRLKVSDVADPGLHGRSEEHTSELQSLMRISYAVF